MMSWGKKKLFVHFAFILCFFTTIAFADSLSYSGRLVNTNGSPVTGPVTIKAELIYSGSTTNILCSEDISNVALTKGVFHVKLDLDCGTSTIAQILSSVPTGQTAAIRITDVTNTKTYSFQSLYSMPFANIAETSKQLVQMGATSNQVLKWNDSSKKWEPGNVTATGTVSNVTASAPLSVTNGTSTPAISIIQADSTHDGYLSSSHWNTFNNKQATITAGTTAQYYRGDKTFQNLDSSNVTENINLYFTNARVLGVPLVGFSNALTGSISASDTILQAFGRTQNQINSLNSNGSNYLLKNGTDTLSGTVTLTNVITATGSGDIVVNSVPLTMTSAVNKTYADGKLDLTTGGTVAGTVNLSSTLNVQNGVRLNPTGTAAGNTGELRFNELVANGTNYVAFKSPDALAANLIFTLPSVDGSAGQILKTNGAGVLSWINDNAGAGAFTGTINRVVLTDGSTGALTVSNVTNTEIGYVSGVTSAIQTQLGTKDYRKN